MLMGVTLSWQNVSVTGIETWAETIKTYAFILYQVINKAVRKLKLRGELAARITAVYNVWWMGEIYALLGRSWAVSM